MIFLKDNQSLAIEKKTFAVIVVRCIILPNHKTSYYSLVTGWC